MAEKPRAEAPRPAPRPKPEAAPPRQDAPVEPKGESPTTNLRGPTPDEILADPLVRTVLDVFEGEVKRVHPRPRGEETKRRGEEETE